MTLYQIVSILKQIALTQPNVKSATDGSVYEVMNTNPSVKYNVVHLSQTKHISDEETDTYGFNIFYISRLEDSLEDNRLQIQSIGKEILDNILRTFCENWNIDFPDIIYYPFTQKFTDLCAGCYCKVEIEVPKEIICADDFIGEVIPSDKNIRLQDVSVTITENGLRVIEPSAGYDGIGQITINTEVPQVAGRLEYKEVEYTGNGEYVIRPGQGYDGLSEVAVSVDVPQSGGPINNQEKDVFLNAQNFEYHPITVPEFSGNPGTYSASLDVTPDAGYTGLDKVGINVVFTASDAFIDGANSQKAKLVATSFTQNSAYTRADGWSSVTVNVDDRYDEGYADGFAAGAAACSGLLASSLTINVANTITDVGTATTTYSPLTAYTDIYYTSSDTTKATINSGTGAITVIANGNVTFCAKDRMSGLQDCKTVAVVKSVETSITINVASVITGSSTATTTVTPSTATTNLVYSSSDTTKATINSGTGVINVVANGQVTFCVRDTISNKQSCKTVYVVTAGTMVSQLDFRYETTGANQTNILFYGTANDNSANFNRFYNALITIVIDGEDVGKSSSNIVTPTVERNYKRYKYTFPTAGVHTVRYYVTRSLSGDGLAGLELTNLLFADNLGEEHLKAAYIGSGYEVLGSGVFQGATEMTAVTIPNTITRIGPFTFEKSNIITLNIPNSVTGLTTIQGGIPTEGEGICSGCTALTSVTIGTGLSKIPHYTFQNCTALRDVTVKRTTPPTLESLAFTGCSSLTNIYVPAGSVNAYKTASGWSTYANKIQAIS